MASTKKPYKRGDKVKVKFEGIVMNSWEGGVRISVRPKPGKRAWWAVVPMTSVEKVGEPNVYE